MYHDFDKHERRFTRVFLFVLMIVLLAWAAAAFIIVRALQEYTEIL